MKQSKEHNNLIIRKPNIPIKVVEDIYTANDLELIVEKIIKDYSILEYIKVINPKLYETYKKNDKKKSNNTLTSLAKYIIRMSYNTSSLHILGEISNSNQQRNEILLEPSMLWINKIIEIIEQQQRADSSLYIYLSHSIHETKNEYIYYSPDTYQSKKISIKKTSFLGELVYWLKVNEGQPLNTIVFQFKDHYPLILKIIKKMLSMNLFVSELSVSNINNCGIKELTKHASLFEKKLLDELIIIDKQIDTYNSSNNKQEQFNKNPLIVTSMSKIIGDDTINYKELVNFNNYFEYPEFEKQDLEASLLKQLPNLDFFRSMYFLTYNYTIMRAFEIYYLDRFGSYSEVSLVEAFYTPDGDIILPKLIEILEKDDTTKKVLDDFENYMRLKIQEQIFLQSDTLDLNQYDIKEIIKIISPLKMHENIKKYVDIKFEYSNDFDRFFLPSLAFSSLQGGFSGKYAKISNYNFKEKDYIFDIDYNANFAPDLGKIYVQGKKSVSIERTTLTSKECISIKDLYISSDKEGLYLINKKTRQKIITGQRNLIDFHHPTENIFASILSDLGNYLSNQPAEFSLHELKSFNYIPRIKYNNIVLSKRTWIIRTEYEKSNFTIEERLREFIIKYKVIDHVAIWSKGREFPLFINTKTGFEFLLKEAKRVNKLVLVEVMDNDLGLPYKYDYIGSIELNGKDFENTIAQSNPLFVKEKSDHYLSYTLIFDSITEDNLVEIIRKVNSINLKFFFIRYFDYGRNSIRLRIRPDNQYTKKNIQQYLQDGGEYKVIEEEYYPEINRYGGRDLIVLSEKIFELESELFMYISDKFDNINKENMGIIMYEDFLISSFNNYQDVEDFYSKSNISNYTSNVYKNKYKKNRNYYQSTSIEYIAVLNTWDKYTELASLISQYIKKCGEKLSEERVIYALNSMLHMRLNRFCGTDKQIEEAVMYLSKYNLYNLKYIFFIKE